MLLTKRFWFIQLVPFGNNINILVYIRRYKTDRYGIYENNPNPRNPRVRRMYELLIFYVLRVSSQDNIEIWDMSSTYNGRLAGYSPIFANDFRTHNVKRIVNLQAVHCERLKMIIIIIIIRFFLFLILC